MRTKWLLITALLLAVVPVVQADSLQLSVNTSYVANLTSPSDSFYGVYLNISTQPPSLDYPSVCCFLFVPVSNVSVFAPAGSVVNHATESIVLPNESLQGTGFVFPAGVFGGSIDPSLPSIAPTFGTSGITQLSVDNVFFQGAPIINGDETSTNFQFVALSISGRFESGLADPGFNWAGYISGQGQVTVPYTIQLDVDYSPVPEPSALALFGTGALGIVSFVRHRFGRVAQL
jgi:hypothetical protein